CAEDSWVEDHGLAHLIADRIGHHGPGFHYARETIRQNASEFVEYLVGQSKRTVMEPSAYLELAPHVAATEIESVQAKIAARVKEERQQEKWPEVEGQFAL